MTFQIVSIADNSPGAQLSNIVSEYKNRQNVCNGDDSIFKQAFMTGYKTGLILEFVMFEVYFLQELFVKEPMNNVKAEIRSNYSHQEPFKI